MSGVLNLRTLFAGIYGPLRVFLFFLLFSLRIVLPSFFVLIRTATIMENTGDYSFCISFLHPLSGLSVFLEPHLNRLS